MEELEQAKQLARDGKFEEALAIYVELGSAAASFGEGACLTKLGRLPEAKAALKNCLEFDPTHEKGRALLEKVTASIEETSGKKKKGAGCCSMLCIILGSMGMIVLGCLLLMA
jgi:tetratricopeptide (TPR) repeat protein